jgi:hypothetical protein
LCCRLTGHFCSVLQNDDNHQHHRCSYASAPYLWDDDTLTCVVLCAEARGCMLGCFMRCAATLTCRPCTHFSCLVVVSASFTCVHARQVSCLVHPTLTRGRFVLSLVFQEEPLFFRGGGKMLDLATPRLQYVGCTMLDAPYRGMCTLMVCMLLCMGIARLHIACTYKAYMYTSYRDRLQVFVMPMQVVA